MSSSAVAATASRSVTESRCLTPDPPAIALRVVRHEGDAVAAVGLGEQHDDRLAVGGRHVLADVVGADRELAVAPVDEHGQLDGTRTPVLGHGVERGADGAPGEQDVVDEDDQPVVEPAVGHVCVAERASRMPPQVVAVEGGVHRTDGRGDPGELGDRRGQPPGQHGTAGRDADEHELRGVLGAERRLLDDLVRDARDGAGDVGGAQQLPVGSAGAARPRDVEVATGLSFPASRDGLKGLEIPGAR